MTRRWEITPVEFYPVEGGGWRVWLNWGVAKPAAPRGPAGPFDREWRWKAQMPLRYGQRCRVLARGGMNSAEIQFEDGVRVIGSRYAVRRVAL